MGFLYQRFYILLFLLWLAGVSMVVSTTLWGDMEGMLRSLGVNGTVTESAGEALGVGEGFFAKIGRLLGEDRNSTSREIASLGEDGSGAAGEVEGNATPPSGEPDAGSPSIPAWKRTEAQQEQAPAEGRKPAKARLAKAKPAWPSPKPAEAPKKGQKGEPASTRQLAKADAASSQPAQAKPSGQTQAAGKASAGAVQGGKAASKSPAGSNAGALTNFDVQEGPDGVTARLSLDRTAERCTYFWMANPLKLVVDLRGQWSADVASVHRLQSGVVEKVVLGEHPDRLRMVFYYRDPDASPESRPQFEVVDGGVVIRLQDGRAAGAAAPGAGTATRAGN